LSAPDIGLDIGSSKIKIARVKKKKDGLQVINFGSKDTPEGAVEGGIIQDAYALGNTITELGVETGLKNKPVATVVSGPQVYTRIFSMPRMKMDELRKAVKYEATTFLPIPAAEAAMDIFPLREYQDADGMKVELFFTAVRRAQVEKLKEVCTLGGLKLKAVDIEPLALNRVLRDVEYSDTVAYLNIGAARSYFSVFKEGILLFNRYFLFGYTGFQQSVDFKYGEPDNPRGGLQGGDQLLVRDIVTEVTRSVEYFAMQKKDELDKILISGGGARIADLDKAIAAGVNCEVEIADTLSRLVLPANLDAEAQDALKYDYAVALGLAARGV